MNLITKIKHLPWNSSKPASPADMETNIVLYLDYQGHDYTKNVGYKLQ